jgi:hypothetical protein
MELASVTEQTRLQVERAERAAEEARGRNQAGRDGRLWRLDKAGEGAPPEGDEVAASDHCAD